MRKTLSGIAYALSIFVVLVCFSARAESQYNLNDLVLVAPSDSALKIDGDISLFSSLEIRKLFLGLPVTRNDIRVEGIVYKPDTDRGELFLKVIVGMTARAYDKKVLQARLSSAGILVPVHNDMDVLLSDFNTSPNAVSFVTYEEAMELNLQVIQVLWQSRN